MRESNVMLLHYATGAAIVVLVAIHLLMRVLIPFVESIQYVNILANYKNLLYASTLELLLITTAVHGFNGLRIILIEWRQSLAWERLVNWGLTIVGAIVVALGTRTILVTNLLLG